MWLGFSTASAEKKIIATTASNNTFDVIDSGNYYSIDLISKAIVKLGVNNISISYPTENQSNTMYNMANSFVSKIGDNKYKLKNLAYYEKNDEDTDDVYSCSKIKPVDDITFEVIDSTHININGISHELVNNDWVYSSKIYDDVYQSIPKFEMDGDWWVDDKSHTVVSDGLNKNIKTPVLVVYNYNNEVGHSDERFF